MVAGAFKFAGTAGAELLGLGSHQKVVQSHLPCSLVDQMEGHQDGEIAARYAVVMFPRG